MSEALITALLVGAIAASVPLMLAGLGELISERAGVLNVGLEGMMLMGAYGGFVVALATGSTWMGFVGWFCACDGVSTKLLSALEFCSERRA